MNRISIPKLLVVLAMLFSIASGPVVASGSWCKGVTASCPCCNMPCCAMHKNVPAQEKPAPVQQGAGQELAAAITSAPFSVLYTFSPTEPKRAPRALFADGHAPEPLSASCIQLI